MVMEFRELTCISPSASPPAPPLPLKSRLPLPTREFGQTYTEEKILEHFDASHILPSLVFCIIGLLVWLLYFLYSRKKKNLIQTQVATSRRRSQKRYVESSESLREHKNVESWESLREHKNVESWESLREHNNGESWESLREHNNGESSESLREHKNGESSESLREHKNGESFESLREHKNGESFEIIAEDLIINTKVVIGKGSGGTLVFEGKFCNIPVAIKCIPLVNCEVAEKEINIIGSFSHHENIIRIHAVAKDKNFMYIVLEHCDLSLYELVMKHKSKNTCLNSSDDNTEIKLWMANGYPSSQLLKLMRDIVNGLACMHENGIVHWDIKPHDILIKIEVCRALVSDMGISKKVDVISLLKTRIGFESLEWQAPELLSQSLAYAADLFSLGCVFFFCISGGYHPFGEEDSVRDSNIVGNISGNKKNLSRIVGIPEAKHLITCLLDPNPLSRPDIKQVMCHPLFWNSLTRLNFFMASSSRLESEFRKNPDSILLQELEKTGKVGDWSEKMDSNFLKTITTIHKPKVYQFNNVRNLVLLIRKASYNYYNYPDNIQKILGEFPEEFLYKFSEKFPNLLFAVYKVIETHCKEEFGFKMYFTPNGLYGIDGMTMIP